MCMIGIRGLSNNKFTGGVRFDNSTFISTLEYLWDIQPMQSYEVAFLCEMSIFIIIKRSYMFVDCNLLDIVSNQKHAMYNPNMEHHTIFQQVT